MSDTNSLSGRLMDDMPPELLHFIKNRVTSFVKFDLIRFFHENHFAYDTAETIAPYAGHDEKSISLALEELVVDGILEVVNIDGTGIYSFTKDGSMRNLVSQFVRACEESEFRTKVIFHIIRGMR